MPDLFGLDIAGLVADGIAGAGGLVPGVLTKVTVAARNPADPTAARVATPISHDFDGFVERLTSTRRSGSSVFEAGEYVSILGATINPPAVPGPGDTILIEGTTYTVEALADRDPAAALYVLKVTA
jgi:hypothetical protein